MRILIGLVAILQLTLLSGQVLNGISVVREGGLNSLVNAKLDIRKDTLIKGEGIAKLANFGNATFNAKFNTLSFTGTFESSQADEVYLNTIDLETNKVLHRELVNKVSRWGGPFAFSVLNETGELVCSEYDQDSKTIEVVRFLPGEWSNKKSVLKIEEISKPARGFGILDKRYYSILTSDKAIDGSRYNELVVVDLQEGRVISKVLLDRTTFNGFGNAISEIVKFDAVKGIMTVIWSHKESKEVKVSQMKLNEALPFKTLLMFEECAGLSLVKELNSGEFLLSGISKDYKHIMYFSSDLSSKKFLAKVSRDNSIGFVTNVD